MQKTNSVQYKDVKNPNKPGRAPAGCVWVKENGQLLRNEEGEIAYRPMTAADRRKAPARKVRTKSRNLERAGSPPVEPNVLLKKRTYSDLSYEQLEQVTKLVNELIEKERAAERKRLESELAAVQERLNRIA